MGFFDLIRFEIGEYAMQTTIRATTLFALMGAAVVFGQVSAAGL